MLLEEQIATTCVERVLEYLEILPEERLTLFLAEITSRDQPLTWAPCFYAAVNSRPVIVTYLDLDTGEGIYVVQEAQHDQGRDEVMRQVATMALSHAERSPHTVRRLVVREVPTSPGADYCFGFDVSIDGERLLFGCYEDEYGPFYERLEGWMNDDMAVETQVSIGEELLEAGDFQAALRAYERASCLEPLNAIWYANRGHCLGLLGRFDEQLICCELALVLEPANPSLLMNRGSALVSLGRLDEAVAAYSTALDQELESPALCALLFYNRGMALLELEQESGARRDFEAARARLTSVRGDGPETQGQQAHDRWLFVCVEEALLMLSGGPAGLQVESSE